MLNYWIPSDRLRGIKRDLFLMLPSSFASGQFNSETLRSQERTWSKIRSVWSSIHVSGRFVFYAQ